MWPLPWPPTTPSCRPPSRRTSSCSAAKYTISGPRRYKCPTSEATDPESGSRLEGINTKVNIGCCSSTRRQRPRRPRPTATVVAPIVSTKRVPRCNLVYCHFIWTNDSRWILDAAVCFVMLLCDSWFGVDFLSLRCLIAILFWFIYF